MPAPLPGAPCVAPEFIGLCLLSRAPRRFDPSSTIKPSHRLFTVAAGLVRIDFEGHSALAFPDAKTRRSRASANETGSRGLP
jgi:hypothetical protein